MTENVDSYDTDKMDAIVITITEPNKFKSFMTRAKTHVVENKTTYITGMVALVVGVILGREISKKNTGAEIPENFEGSEVDNFGTVTQLVASGFKTRLDNYTYNTTSIIVNPEPVKRLSYIVKMGDKYWETQRAFAEEMGVPENHVSAFLNGKKHHLDIDSEELPTRIGVRSES